MSLSRALNVFFLITIALAFVLPDHAQAVAIVPYSVALDSSTANQFDIYNPQSAGGLTAPVEFFQATIQSATGQNSVPFPARVVMSSPTGSTPTGTVSADFYYDGPANSFPTQAVIDVDLVFTTAAQALGILGQVYSYGSYNSIVQVDYQSPAPSTIIHNFQSTVGTAQSNLVLELPYVEPSQPGMVSDFEHIYTIDDRNGLPVDPSQPIIQVTMTVTGALPEPSSIVLAGGGLAALLACSWRLRSRLV